MTRIWRRGKQPRSERKGRKWSRRRRRGRRREKKKERKRWMLLTCEA